MTDKPSDWMRLSVGTKPKVHPSVSDYRAWVAGQVIARMDPVNPNLPGDHASPRIWPEPEELATRRAKWALLQADALIAELAK